MYNRKGDKIKLLLVTEFIFGTHNLFCKTNYRIHKTRPWYFNR